MAAFRHQLWLEHLEVLDEFRDNDTTLFVLKRAYLCPWEIENLLKIVPFTVLNLYYDGNLRMHLQVLDE